MDLQTKLRSLKGVGEKTENLLAKLGLVTCQDLLYDYPRAYDEYAAPVPLSQARPDQIWVVKAKVAAPLALGSRAKTVSATLADASGTIQATWFHASYLVGVLHRGGTYVFRGKVKSHGNRLVFEHPEILSLAEYEEKQGHLWPIYGLTAGLSGKMRLRLARLVLEEAAPEEDFLPDQMRTDLGLPTLWDALKTIHFPQNHGDLTQARRRLAFDEFLLFILAVQMAKQEGDQAPNAFPMKRTWETQRLLEGLPYQLTGAQQRAWQEVERDLCSQKLMARLIQGDVGSGKTILAFLAMVQTVENGYQAALMVPTEVLARQHFESFVSLADAQGLASCRPVLLVGSLSAAQKKKIRKGIAEGSYNIIIGTHALVQEAVSYPCLALAITDEQHRFGVRQREALASKGSPPHVLVMSATPIPRTLAIILYGDLDVSILDELPAKRLPIKNAAIRQEDRSKAYRFLESQLKAGRQAYVICPMVEESEGLDAENVTDYAALLRQTLPEEYKISVLHGRMKPKEKTQVMDDFLQGSTAVLVSTTVVEVGVNVPNATVILIENADRFGLAQLHQLRGRVGRGQHQSYCIFIQGETGEEGTNRLQVLTKSNDGFFISGEDLRLRGPGDFFGVRQSGDLAFRVADIYRDADLLTLASAAAGSLLQKDPLLALPEHTSLAQRLHQLTTAQLQGLDL